MDSDTQELKPCPFCGADNPLELGNMYEERFKFTYTACKCVSPAHRTRPAAIEAWNTRAFSSENAGEVYLNTLRLAIEVVNNERVSGETETESDRVYNQALEDAIASLTKLIITPMLGEALKGEPFPSENDKKLLRELSAWIDEFPGEPLTTARRFSKPLQQLLERMK